MRKNERFHFILAAALFAGLLHCPAATAAPAAPKMPVTCRNYARVTLCYPAGWLATPSMPFSPGQELGQNEEFYADATRNTAAKVTNLSYEDKKAEWLYDPIKQEEGMHPGKLLPCGGGKKNYCYNWLGKKKINGFTAYYYTMSFGGYDMGKDMLVYLVKPPGDIYKFEFMASNTAFKKYETDFYAMLGTFRLRKN